MVDEPQETSMPEAPPSLEDEGVPAEGTGPASPPPLNVEPHLSLEEFLTVLPDRGTRSQAVQKAAAAALTRWLRLRGHDAWGHYPLTTWQAHYADMLAHRSPLSGSL